MFNYDLNVPLVEALGLTAPPQQELTIIPYVNGFDVYTDYIAAGIVESSWSSEGQLDYCCRDKPASGDFCIHWTGVSQYGTISLRFAPVKDLSVLLDNDFALDFWVRCAQPGAQVDFRFLDTKTDEPNDHPWRMRHKIDQNLAEWDGQWHHVRIPLQDFSEHGSWDNGWFNPADKFDWTAIDYFEIVAEYGNLEGIHFYFDNIRIVEPDAPTL